MCGVVLRFAGAVGDAGLAAAAPANGGARVKSDPAGGRAPVVEPGAVVGEVVAVDVDEQRPAGAAVGNGVVRSAFEVAEGVGARVLVREARVVADTGEGAGGVGEVGASAARQPA